MRIHAGLPDLREPSRIAGWVHRVAHNVWIDSRRARNESVGGIELAAIEQEPSGSDFAREVGRWLLGEMKDLDATTREVLRRFELENEPQQQIADALELSLSAVKARLLRGRAQMRRRLERCCEFEFDRSGQPIEARRLEGRARGCGDSDSAGCARGRGSSG